MNEDDFYDLTPEEQIELQQTMQDMNYPTPSEKASIFNIFKKIIGTKNSSKVGNLDLNELHAVRIAQQVSLYVETQGYDLVSKYFMRKGEIVLSTSLSKKAALIEALITQKRALSSDKKTLREGGKKTWKEKKEEKQA